MYSQMRGLSFRKKFGHELFERGEKRSDRKAVHQPGEETRVDKKPEAETLLGKDLPFDLQDEVIYTAFVLHGRGRTCRGSRISRSEGERCGHAGLVAVLTHSPHAARSLRLAPDTLLSATTTQSPAY